MSGVYNYHMVTTVTCNGIQKYLILDSMLLGEKFKTLSGKYARHINSTFLSYFISNHLCQIWVLFSE